MNDTNTISKNNSDKVVIPIIIALSLIVPLAVAALILFPDVFKLEMGIDRSTLPAFHAILNGTTTVLLIVALLFIRRKNIAAHRASMLSAFALSAVFLVSYVISKLNADPTPYGGEGAMRGLYFFILISHILLSVPVLPLAMFAIYRGWTGEIAKHKKLCVILFQFGYMLPLPVFWYISLWPRTIKR
jgi:putative membrane protein